MALFSMRVQTIGRNRVLGSAVAAAAYRACEKIRDEREGVTHDYSRKPSLVHKEIIVPDNAPGWARKLDRHSLWNMVEKRERRKDAQSAREIRVMLPREIGPEERISLVRDFVQRNFVSKGMIADVCWHNDLASDGGEQPHAHIMLTMRPLEADGFGDKVRHDMIPDPSGRTRPDGRPVLVPSNPDSWNLDSYYESTRADWQALCNAALERAGSAERIDRRSYLERGIVRMPEPALRLAFHLKELRGVMQERFGQFQYARFYRGVEERAKEAYSRFEQSPLAVDALDRMERFHAWFDRTLDRLAPAREDHERGPPEPPLPEPERGR